jgi:predicted dehydrogenase
LGESAEELLLEVSKLDSAPPTPAAPLPGIGLIGCGGISEMHLGAYRRLGFEVLGLCNRDVGKARARAEEFYPEAHVCSDHRELIAVAGVEIVDIATHPEGRGELIGAALRAGKHVLSQKPFVLDLEEGEELVALAAECGVRLAVNQNGRWAPHFAGIRAAVEDGLIGEVESIEAGVSWDHSWTVGTAFDETEHLILFDFGIHWFDFVASLTVGREIEEVSASTAFSQAQRSPQPMLAEVSMWGPGLRVRLAFDGDCGDGQRGDRGEGQRDVTVVRGSLGALVSEGPDLEEQKLWLHRTGGAVEIPLVGGWFTTGFEGSVCELVCAVQEGREPAHGAAGNLRGLALSFAACESAGCGRQVRPASVRKLR